MIRPSTNARRQREVLWLIYLLLVAAFMLAGVISRHHRLGLCAGMTSRVASIHCEDSLRDHDAAMHTLGIMLFAGCNAFAYQVGLLRQGGTAPTGGDTQGGDPSHRKTWKGPELPEPLRVISTRKDLS